MHELFCKKKKKKKKKTLLSRVGQEPKKANLSGSLGLISGAYTKKAAVDDESMIDSLMREVGGL